MSDPSEDLLVSSRGVRKRYDDVSHMWIVRRLADDPSNAAPKGGATK